MKTPLAFTGGLAFQPQAQLATAPFARVPAPAVLHVPLPGQSPGALPPGTEVRQGDSLTIDGHGPPAPLDGATGGQTDALLSDGRMARAVIFHPRPASDVGATAPAAGSTDAEAPLDELWRAGVAADRRLSPDLTAQLASIAEHPVKVVICNLVDHEPPVALSAAILWHDSPAVLAAAQYLRRACKAERIILAVNQTVSPLLETFQRRAEQAGAELVFLPERYPQAHPTLLLYSLLGARLRPELPPTHAGALVIDGPALLAAGQYLLRRQKVLELPLALHDHTSGRLHYLLAAPGTPLGHLLRSISAPGAPLTLYAGDLMARRQCPMEAVLAASGELVVHIAHAEEEAVIPSACVRSGWCIEYCPTHVQPAALLDAAQRNDPALAEEAGLHACIGCGICSYVCPSDLPLAAAIRTLKPDAHVRR